MGSNIGIYNLHMRAMGGGEKLTLVLAEHLSLSHNVWLFCAEPLDISLLESFFDVDLSRITVVPLNAKKVFRAFGRLRGLGATASILQHHLQLRKFKLDLFINNSYASSLRCPAPRGVFMCMFPHSRKRFFRSRVRNRPGKGQTSPIQEQMADVGVKSEIDSYSIVVAISQYAADWVRQMWNCPAEIIYPPCDDMGPPMPKQKMILNVGRFIPDANNDELRHQKGQRLLLDAFKQMSDLHRNGWELRFVGSIGTDKQSATFAETLLRDATGLPVSFHFNGEREVLRDLYRRAAIYWHATGYGFDLDRYPAKHEHFGIATVEAMSAAAVPVVYASGGQAEIVTDGNNGFRWDDIDGLKTKTRRLAYDAELGDRLSRNATDSSKRFGRNVFASKMDQVIATLLAAPPS